MNNRQVQVIDSSAPSSSSSYLNHGTIRCDSVNHRGGRGSDDKVDPVPFSTEDYCVQFFAPEVSTTDDQYAIRVSQDTENDEFIDYFNTYMLENSGKNCSIFIPDYKDPDWNRKDLRHTIKESKDQDVTIFGTYKKVPDSDFRVCIENGFDYAVKKQAQYNREQGKADQEALIILGYVVGGLVGVAALLVCVYYVVNFTHNKYKQCVDNQSERKKLVEQSDADEAKTCNLGQGFSKCVSIFFRKQDPAVDGYNKDVRRYGTFRINDI